MMRGRGDFAMEGGYGGSSISGAGYAVAAGVGGGLLWALAWSLLSLVNLLGLNLVYLRVTEGLDSGAAEAALQAGLDEAKRQAAELGQKAKDAADRAREQAKQAAAPKAADVPAPPITPAATPPAAPAAASVPTPPIVSLTCPQCHAAVGHDDGFCGTCGHKLK